MLTFSCALIFILIQLLKCSGNNVCEDDLDCDTRGSICLNFTCSCPEGYIVNSDKTKCLLESSGFGGQCEDNVQCSAVLQAGGQCKYGRCQCAVGFHYLRGQCIRSAGVLEPCKHDNHCFSNYDFEATACKDKKCQCSNGYYLREYSACRRASYAPGEPCGITQDCHFKDAVCTMARLCDFKNTSQPIPPEDFSSFVKNQELFKSKNNNFEVKNLILHNTMKVETNCSKTEDCATLNNSYCSSNNKCQCKQGYYSSDTLDACFPELGSPCLEDSECRGRNTMCRNSTWCTCRPGFVANPDNRFCQKLSRNIGWSCLHDAQCSFFGEGGRCVKKKCTCSSGTHFEKSHLFCWRSKNIGEECLTVEDCSGNGVQCRSGKCNCISGYHAALNSSECRKDAKSPGDVCIESSDCVFRHSTCQDGQCGCSKGYFNQGNQCLTGIGGLCKIDEECLASRSICIATTCVCSEGFVPSKDSSKCLLIVKTFGKQCLENAQCSEAMGPMAACINNKCTCTGSTHYVLDKESNKSSGQYYMNVRLGEPCTQTQQCIEVADKNNLEGSTRTVCRKGICSCHFQYTYDPDNNICTGNGNFIFVDATMMIMMIMIMISVHFW